MYGKIFDSMYDGTLRANWQGLVTFQQVIVLCDADGVLDMTPHAISGRTGIPLEIIEAGIAYLESPDPYSRTPDEEGRRIVRIDDHRPWGWIVVNHGKYKALQDADTKREQTRERVKKHRDKQREDVTHSNANVTAVTHGNGQKRHTDTDTDTDTDITPSGVMSGDARRTATQTAKTLLSLLNEKAGRAFQPTKVNLDFILARLKEGYDEATCRAVIVRKCREWSGDAKMAPYMRPSTLFNREKFNQYAGECVE